MLAEICRRRRIKNRNYTTFTAFLFAVLPARSLIKSDKKTKETTVVVAKINWILIKLCNVPETFSFFHRITRSLNFLRAWNSWLAFENCEFPLSCALVWTAHKLRNFKLFQNPKSRPISTSLKQIKRLTQILSFQLEFQWANDVREVLLISECEKKKWRDLKPRVLGRMLNCFRWFVFGNWT